MRIGGHLSWASSMKVPLVTAHFWPREYTARVALDFISSVSANSWTEWVWSGMEVGERSIKMDKSVFQNFLAKKKNFLYRILPYCINAICWLRGAGVRREPEFCPLVLLLTLWSGPLSAPHRPWCYQVWKTLGSMTTDVPSDKGS